MSTPRLVTAICPLPVDSSNRPVASVRLLNARITPQLLSELTRSENARLDPDESPYTTQEIHQDLMEALEIVLEPDHPEVTHHTLNQTLYAVAADFSEEVDADGSPSDPSDVVRLVRLLAESRITVKIFTPFQVAV